MYKSKNTSKNKQQSFLSRVLLSQTENLARVLLLSPVTQERGVSILSFKNSFKPDDPDSISTLKWISVTDL